MLGAVEEEITMHQQLELVDKVEVVLLEYMDHQIQQLQELTPLVVAAAAVPVKLEFMMH
jgi:hypothetical protein